jgi:transcription antitermination factor NusG
VVRSFSSELCTIEAIVREHALHIVERVTYVIGIVDSMGALKRSLIVTRGEIAKLELPQTT